MDPKALKKLADACRKAGIKHYKCAEFEFTLSEDGPISNYKRRALSRASASEPTAKSDSPFSTDSLTEDQLLMWSVGETTSEESAQ